MIDDSYPLVSFVILSFNSEDYISEALNSALSQDYPNVEIIVSDDCSSDDSVKIVESISNQYFGEKSIIFHRNTTNKCTLGNFFSAARLASGDLIVLSAADDVSRYDRVSKIVNAWIDTRPAAIFSACEIIDSSGEVTHRYYEPSLESSMANNIFGKQRKDILGCSSAYDARFISTLPKIDGRFLFEDSYMSFMVEYHKQSCVFLNETLVKYRNHSSSISNSHGYHLNIKEEIINQLRSAKYDDNKYQMYKAIYFHVLRDGFPELASKVFLHSDVYRIKSRWYDYNLFYRLYCLFTVRERSLLKWMILRIFGLKAFALAKFLLKKFAP